MCSAPPSPDTTTTVPRATYRLQLHKDFSFDDAAAIAGYLAELGVSHVYTSPGFQAAPGSAHGYDVVDFSRLNEELGGEEGNKRLTASLRDHGLGRVIDIVPNHMAIGSGGNRWWWDVLENGPSSRYASYFDVDWDPPDARLRNTVLLPILGDHYGRVLERGEIRLTREGGTFFINYFEHVMPVSPRSLDKLLEAAAALGGASDLAFIAQAYNRLPLATATDIGSGRARHRHKEILRRQLSRLVEEREVAAQAIDGVVEALNADLNGLESLLERQNYRLAYWRTAGRELDYRRFFDVSTLIGLRAENDHVFEETHELVLRLRSEGGIDGFRVDHIDGLREPARYLRRLASEAPGAWLVVEKILEPGERLPESWPVSGTTGYEFAARADGLFIDPAGEQALTDFNTEFSGESADWPEVIRQKKHLMMRDVLASDINRLTGLFAAICERHRRYRDCTRHQLHEVLCETIACFAVYRTYVSAADGVLGEQDLGRVDEAIARAQTERPELDVALFTFLRDILLLHVRGADEDELAMRFQQTSGPVMAKGVEDTAFYVFNRLVALNEVGGDPGRFGWSPTEFHAASAETQERWPDTMLTTSTHDSKRSGDVRCRLALLSEIPDRWATTVRRWSETTSPYRPPVLDANTEYLLYQTLVGAWPLSKERAVAYMEKASREARVHTSWIDPKPEYDDALKAFVAAALDDRSFVEALDEFVKPLVEPGRVNSLAQTLLKLTAPGVPDLYQGSEVWNLSLVDPDNRRPINYALRRRLLAECGRLSAREVLCRSREGLPKLWLIKRTLEARARRQHCFGATGAYTPLYASGSRAQHVVAFLRGGQALTVVPRLVLGLTGGARGFVLKAIASPDTWDGTALELPPGWWRNELTGQTIAGGPTQVAGLFSEFPVALLFLMDGE